MAAPPNSTTNPPLPPSTAPPPIPIPPPAPPISPPGNTPPPPIPIPPPAPSILPPVTPLPPLPAPPSDSPPSNSPPLAPPDKPSPPPITPPPSPIPPPPTTPPPSPVPPPITPPSPEPPSSPPPPITPPSPEPPSSPPPPTPLPPVSPPSPSPPSPPITPPTPSIPPPTLPPITPPPMPPPLSPPSPPILPPTPSIPPPTLPPITPPPYPPSPPILPPTPLIPPPTLPPITPPPYPPSPPISPPTPSIPPPTLPPITPPPMPPPPSPSPPTKKTPPPMPPPPNPNKRRRNPHPPKSPFTPGTPKPPPSPLAKPTPPAVPSPPESSNTNGTPRVRTVVPIALAVFVFLAAVGIIWYIRKKRKVRGYDDVHAIQSQMGSRAMGHSSASGLVNSTLFFTYEELAQSTNNFSSDNILGRGGFGRVYKGHLPDGREVAVKQLIVGGGQGEREFRAEVEIISRIHHRHLVLLVGYCMSENERLLVYEFVPNRTLHYHLHITLPDLEKEGPAMDWATRVKVAAGAGRGITYLHEDCHPRIIHRDIKSSNILLDNSFEAKVSDFGLAKIIMDAQTHVPTRIIGTFGCVAPEYSSCGRLTTKSDVFAFGVVLLELITGCKPVLPSQESLVGQARKVMKLGEAAKLKDLPDPKLEGKFDETQMLQMIHAAEVCVQSSDSERPRMETVMKILTGNGNLDLDNGVTPGASSSTAAQTVNI